MKHFLLAIAMFAFGSSAYSDAVPAPSPGTEMEPNFTEDGKMILFGGRAKSKDGKVLQETLDHDYGLIIWNDGTYDVPVARYVLAERKAKKKTWFDNLDSLRAALAKLPKGAFIMRYDTCTAGTAPGRWKTHPTARVAAICRKLGIRYKPWSDGGMRIFCTCP